MRYVIKDKKSGTYFHMQTGIGPKFGARMKDAQRFPSKHAALRMMASHSTAFTFSEIEGVLKGFNVKYALTSGIFEVEVRESDDGKYVYTLDAWPIQLRIGKTFFQDRDSAEARAKQLARQKVASLKRQIAKIEKLTRKPLWGKP